MRCNGQEHCGALQEVASKSAKVSGFNIVVVSPTVNGAFCRQLDN